MSATTHKGRSDGLGIAGFPELGRRLKKFGPPRICWLDAFTLFLEPVSRWAEGIKGKIIRGFLCEHGLYCERNKARIPCLWSAVEGVRYFGAPLRQPELRVTTQDGTLLHFSNYISEMDELHQELCAKTGPRLRTRALERLRQGETATFGPIVLCRAHLSNGPQPIPWKRIKCIVAGLFVTGTGAAAAGGALGALGALTSLKRLIRVVGFDDQPLADFPLEDVENFQVLVELLASSFKVPFENLLEEKK